MVRKYNALLLTLLVLTDLAVTALGALLAFYLRFHFSLTLRWLPPHQGVPDFEKYLKALPVILVVALFSYRASHLYVPRRAGRFFREVIAIFRANALTLLTLLVLNFFLRWPADPSSWSRGAVVIFAAVNFFLLTGERLCIRVVLRFVRGRRHNLRHVLVAGAGKLGQALVERIGRNPWTGLNVVGFVDDDPERRDKSFLDRPVLGKIADIDLLIRERNLDQIFIALPFAELAKVRDILDTVAEHTIDVRVVPDLHFFTTLNPRVTELDGLAILDLKESPFVGWHGAAKRVLDVVASIVALLLASPVMLFFAIWVKLTSPGPIFYKQERMGLDGRVFQILKLRSMRVDAESETGPVWARADDPRRTRVGEFMRRWNIDELPQFFNVLKGSMSVVGPRPERPVFIEEFKKTVPKYMLRHKVKAGITGWAQVNGWRGDTSLEKRIQYDVYYIENWSLWFDLWIILLTPFARKHAY